MEDDGTVNMRKEPSSSNLGEVYFGEDGDDEAAAAAASAAGGSSSAGAAGGASPSLASFLGQNNNDRGSTIAGGEGGRGGGGGIVSVDLKELLPKQKMKFLKLDVSIYYINISHRHDWIQPICLLINRSLYVPHAPVEIRS